MTGEDDLSDDVEAAINAAMASGTEPSGKNDGAAPPSGDAPPPVESSGGERARDENGRFAPKEAEPAKQPEPAATKQIPSTETVAGAPPANVPKASPIPPPVNWKGAGKTKWNLLPVEVQKELSEELSGASKASSEAQTFRSAIGEDRAQRLAAEYGSVENGLKSILAGADMANQRPLEFIQWLAQRAGINLASLAGQDGNQGHPQPQGMGQPNYQSSPYEQKIAQLEERIQAVLQQHQQASTAPILAEIERFRADPANPYFNDVEQDINRLLHAGMVKGTSPSERLKNAYDMAMWARPDLRQTLLAQERERLMKEDAAKVEAARKANGSITGSPAGGKVPDSVDPDEDLDATVRRLVNAR